MPSQQILSPRLHMVCYLFHFFSFRCRLDSHPPNVSNVLLADILNPEQTLREQGFVGDIICGLFSQVGTDGLYSQLPFHEGKLFRKKATSLRGLKSSLANWVRRWYVLRKNQFAYFKSREDDRPLGFINLNQTKNIRKIKVSETELLKDIPPKYKNLCFAVDT